MFCVTTVVVAVWFGISNSVSLGAVNGTLCVVLPPSRYSTVPEEIPAVPAAPIDPV